MSKYITKKEREKTDASITAAQVPDLQSFIMRRISLGCPDYKILDDAKTFWPDETKYQIRKEIADLRVSMKEALELYNSDKQAYLKSVLLGTIADSVDKAADRLKAVELLAKLDSMFVEKTETKIDAANIGFNFGIDEIK